MKSFLQGKPSLALTSLRAPSAPVTSGAGLSCETTRTAALPRTHTPSAGNATVEVVKEGDKVVRLIVICACGERVEVECLYPAGR